MMTIQQNAETCKCEHDSHQPGACLNPDCEWMDVNGLVMELCQRCFRKHLGPKLQPHQWHEVGNSYIGHGESEYRYVCDVCHARGWRIVDNETGEEFRMVGNDEPCAKTARQVLIARLHNSR